MKNTLLTLLLVLCCLPAISQTYNSPESIEFDYANNRWLIANNSGSNILARSSATGTLTVFTSLPVGPHGLEIVDTVLYVCDGARIRGYGLTGAAEVFNVNLGATFLNGLTHDDSGNLFATDFSAKKIYRISIASGTFNVFATGLTKSPNGIIYDQPNNRCVFVNWGASASIMAVSLADSSVSTVKTTSLSNIDGIARDAAGNYFVSSWGLNGISMFDNTFTTGPTTVVSGLNNPADICYNTLTDTLGVPNAGSSLNNTTYHYLGGVTAIQQPDPFPSVRVYPNPAVDEVYVQLLAEPVNAGWVVTDLQGRVLLADCSTSDLFRIQVKDLPAGYYLLSVEGYPPLRFGKQ